MAVVGTVDGVVDAPEINQGYTIFLVSLIENGHGNK